MTLMKLSAIITATTRKLHGLAVRAHVASLRLTVATAEAEKRIALKVEEMTRDYVKKAEAVARDAERDADRAILHANNVRAAAAQEAASLGGAL
ncbi:hypothetical protein WS83_03890 [Burkholderia sp. MSMB2042]|nr:hypothetical protein WS78_10820 [Burkholderia savannae]KVG39832.1 hypothetical protein WS77_19370 [Burkholderia sp. MSMB0265]KVG85756.1 hypothetical protein WS81_31305 [Burkholderia sp. MSMB2040]KVG92228.1 hypothetical protein WS82_12345 [Burkholderia sp. MSMB2041]KVG95693.1 hypothetical protein WS83_03890 [Burkholderia sp. MSMB2042]